MSSTLKAHEKFLKGEPISNKELGWLIEEYEELITALDNIRNPDYKLVRNDASQKLEVLVQFRYHRNQT